MTRSVRAGRRGTAAVLVLGLLAVAGPARAAGQDDLTLTEASRAADGTARVVATVPVALSDTDLTTAFSATAGGAAVPLRVTRVLPGAELVLALDASGDAQTLAVEQSAAADLLRALPPDTLTTVLPSGSRTGARDALAAVAALRPAPGGLLDGLPAPSGVRRLVVALTGCPALTGETRSVPGAGDAGTQVSVLALGAACDDAAARLAGASPGVVRTGLDPGRMFAAVDDTARALLGQYVLQSTAPVGAGPLQVSVPDGASTVTAGVQLPAPVAASSTGTSTDDAPGWAVLLAVVLAALTAAGLGAELLARRTAQAAS